MNGEVHGLDRALGVIAAHARPVNAAMTMIDFCLHIKDACDAPLSHLLYVLLCLRVGPNEDGLLANLLESQISNEVRIALLNMTIHKEDIVAVAPLQDSLLITVLVDWPLCD